MSNVGDLLPSPHRNHYSIRHLDHPGWMENQILQWQKRIFFGKFVFAEFIFFKVKSNSNQWQFRHRRKWRALEIRSLFFLEIWEGAGLWENQRECFIQSCSLAPPLPSPSFGTTFPPFQSDPPPTPSSTCNYNAFTHCPPSFPFYKNHTTPLFSSNQSKSRAGGALLLFAEPVILPTLTSLMTMLSDIQQFKVFFCQKYSCFCFKG